MARMFDSSLCIFLLAVCPRGILPDTTPVACEEFFTSDLRQTRRTAPHQHRLHRREREPLLPWGGPTAEVFAVCWHLDRYMTT